MEISATHSHWKAGALPPEQLAANPNLPEGEKVAELSRQFEAMLLRQILGEAQKTVFQSKHTSESTATSIYRDIVTNQLADSISQSGSLGLGRTLEQQLTRQLNAAAPKESGSS